MHTKKFWNGERSRSVLLLSVGRESTVVDVSPPGEAFCAVSSRHQLSDPLSCPSAARQAGSPGWILSAASNSWIARPTIHFCA
jgi:hypothetical protein